MDRDRWISRAEHHRSAKPSFSSPGYGWAANLEARLPVGSASRQRLEAQRRTIDACAANRGAEVLARFTEVESGKIADRPELSGALHLAKVTGATLVIAKLDRLSRNAAFLLTVRDSGARFLACDLPEANDLTVGIMALVAQAEREAISRRTREALAVAKTRGIRLGNPNGAAALRRAGQGGAPLRAAVTQNADRHAADLAEAVEDSEPPARRACGPSRRS